MNESQDKNQTWMLLGATVIKTVVNHIMDMMEKARSDEMLQLSCSYDFIREESEALPVDQKVTEISVKLVPKGAAGMETAIYSDDQSEIDQHDDSCGSSINKESKMGNRMVKWFNEDMVTQMPDVTIVDSCHELAERMDRVLPEGPEKTTGMRKLVEAMDCFIRADIEGRENNDSQS